MGTPSFHINPKGVTEASSFSCYTVTSNFSPDRGTVVSTSAEVVSKTPLDSASSSGSASGPGITAAYLVDVPLDKCCLDFIQQSLARHSASGRHFRLSCLKLSTEPLPIRCGLGKGGPYSVEYTTYKWSRSILGSCRSSARGQGQ